MKKGISPLIAAVLLIAFVVAISMLVMGWMSTLTRTTTATVTNKTDLAVSCSDASINIEDVYVQNNTALGASITNGTIRAIVKNTGFGAVTIQSAQVYDINGTNSSAEGLTISLSKGAITALVFYTNQTWPARCPTAFSRLTVTTTCGGVSDTFTKTPKCAN